MSSVKWWPFCPGADELIMYILMCHWLNLPCWIPWYIECDYVRGCWVLLSIRISLTNANIWNSMHRQQHPFPNAEEWFCLLCGHCVYQMYAFNAYIHLKYVMKLLNAYIDGLVQERRNSNALAMSICGIVLEHIRVFVINIGSFLIVCYKVYL